MDGNSEEVWITGIGLVSSIGEGAETHWDYLGQGSATPIVDNTTYAPYPVHPLTELDFSKQIPRKGDLRQMEPWQRIGVYAAGLALSDAGIAGQREYLDKTNLVVAAGSGERDTTMDQKILETISDRNYYDLSPNEILPSELRPTLFLAQLSNLLAGNISIIHKASGSSRTFMGEEMAGISVVESALRRIEHNQGELFLIGGACNAQREDLLLISELGQNLWGGEFKPIWERRSDGGGFVLGSVGAFLVVESKSHALSRGARAYAKLSDVTSGRCNRQPGLSVNNANAQFDLLGGGLPKGPLAVLSGASGAEPATFEELSFLEDLEWDGYDTAIRAYGTMLGHSVEAHFPAGIALAALALSKGSFFNPFDSSGIESTFKDTLERVLVTGWGHWRGEGLALVEKIESQIAGEQG